jgi:hypothetical protein
MRQDFSIKLRPRRRDRARIRKYVRGKKEKLEQVGTEKRRGLLINQMFFKREAARIRQYRRG